jgi:3-deoxy-manno-octulosonate cytidylyltransferase (CMP-KDO synthetase)
MSTKRSRYKIIIPARYASTRLPGKPLREIAGKPMIQHTYEQALQSLADEVVIATDDPRIFSTAQQFSADVVMTSAAHTSGTERLAEVVEKKAWADDTIIVNVQGDEPLVAAQHIELVAQALEQFDRAGMSTLAAPVNLWTELSDPHIVKVVMDHQGYALYFSRAVIPWDRDGFSTQQFNQDYVLPDMGGWFRHIGMYAYRAATLKQYITLQTCMLEITESLEQLRVLYHGIPIHVTVTNDEPSHGVDVESDLVKVEALLKKTSST